MSDRTGNDTFYLDVEEITVESETIEDYGFKHERGFPQRAHFIIDCEGTIRAKRVEPSTKDHPDVGAVLADLDGAL